MSDGVRKLLVVAGAVAVVGFGTWWGYKFWRVYLAAWSTDERLNNVFVRMTASDAKPFYAMKFIKDNKLSGNMFNYWTEGGFIAWGQEPDPNTGRTPLRLFMDGRAQAAYDRRAYDVWQGITAGGRIAYDRDTAARARGKELDAEDYREIGKWIDAELKKRNVWLVLWPSSTRETPFLDAIEHMSNWQIVYFDDQQRITVDTDQEKGRELFEKARAGEAIYPDASTRQLMMSRIMRVLGKDKKQIDAGLAAAIEALNLHPSLASAGELNAYARRWPELSGSVGEVFSTYLEDLAAREKSLRKKHGQLDRLTAGLIASHYLQAVASQHQDQDGFERYAKQYQEFRAQQDELLKDKRW